MCAVAPLHYADQSASSKCWLFVNNVAKPTAKLTVSGIGTFGEAPLLQLTHSLANSLQQNKLTIRLEYVHVPRCTTAGKCGFLPATSRWPNRKGARHSTCALLYYDA
jgi:hypothetical protein